MSNTILLKRSGNAAAVPAAANLSLGELSLNYADGILYFLNSSNAVTVLANANTVSGIQLVNGNSNVVVSNNSNITISSAGTANVLTISSLGIVASGTASISGNVTGGNVLTGGQISATGNITGGNIIGNGRQLTSLYTTATTITPVSVANTIITLSNTSTAIQVFTSGASNVHVRIPDTTTCILGQSFEIINRSSQNIAIENYAGGSYGSISPNAISVLATVTDTTSTTGLTLSWQGSAYTGTGGTLVFSQSPQFSTIYPSAIDTGGGGTITYGQSPSTMNFGGSALAQTINFWPTTITGNSTYTRTLNLATAGGTSNTVVNVGNVANTTVNIKGTTNFANAITANSTISATGNIIGATDLYIGNGAASTTFTNPIAIFKDIGTGYVQVAVVNSASTASADFTAYGNNGDDQQSWMDMGFTGNAFSDTNYTITGSGDGYLFTQGNTSFGGNLVLATGNTGTTRDIVFSFGFLSANEFVRFQRSTNTILPYANTTANLGSSTNWLNNLYVASTTGTTISATGNVTGGNILTTGLISTVGNLYLGTGNAGYIYGNGTYLTGISAAISVSKIENGNSNVWVQTAGGDVTVTAGGVSNVAVFSTGSMILQGAIGTPKIISANVVIAANINGMLIGPLTFANGVGMTVPTSSTVYIYAP